MTLLNTVCGTGCQHHVLGLLLTTNYPQYWLYMSDPSDSSFSSVTHSKYQYCKYLRYFINLSPFYICGLVFVLSTHHWVVVARRPNRVVWPLTGFFRSRKIWQLSNANHDFLLYFTAICRILYCPLPSPQISGLFWIPLRPVWSERGTRPSWCNATVPTMQCVLSKWTLGNVS